MAWYFVKYRDNFTLISRKRALLEKLTVVHLLQKFPAFHEIRWFITVFRRTPPPTGTHSTSSIRSILILSSRIRLHLPSGPFPSCFQTKGLYEFLISPMRARCPAHLYLLDVISVLIFCQSTIHGAPHYATF
jgi:hypothetical protein